MRTLQLTSPLMHGPDVKDLQKAVNHWLSSHHEGGIQEDGQFGPITEHAVGKVAYQMGLVHRNAIPPVQRVIEHPHLRTPNDLSRSHKRAEAAKAHGAGLAGVLNHAQSHIGVAESPPGSNTGRPFPSGWEENFHTDGVSWCGCFYGSMVLDAGGHVNSRVAYCPYIEADAKSKTNGFDEWVPGQGGPPFAVEQGWAVLYDWTGNRSFPEHVGVVESVGPTHVTAVEGNTSGTNPSDGGMVARMERDYGFVVGYARPKF